jgi:hypothetical protein
MGTPYETDVAAWAIEQATLLRSGKLSAIDVLNIAEEIEGVSKSEQRALASHLGILLAHLLKWKFQPARRGRSWRSTILAQRAAVMHILHKAPSLKHAFEDEEWLTMVWRDAVAKAQLETNLDFPEAWIWSVDAILEDFSPD